MQEGTEMLTSERTSSPHCLCENMGPTIRAREWAQVSFSLDSQVHLDSPGGHGSWQAGASELSRPLECEVFLP